MSNTIIWILTALAGAYIIVRFISWRFSGVVQVRARQAQELIDEHDAVVIDVRTHDEYAAGRIPNAKHIPLSQIRGRLKELDRYRERPIVVSCRSGSRSARACKMLKKNGFEHVYNLKGGLHGWARANGSVVK